MLMNTSNGLTAGLNNALAAHGVLAIKRGRFRPLVQLLAPEKIPIGFKDTQPGHHAEKRRHLKKMMHEHGSGYGEEKQDHNDIAAMLDLHAFCSG